MYMKGHMWPFSHEHSHREVHSPFSFFILYSCYHPDRDYGHFLSVFLLSHVSSVLLDPIETGACGVWAEHTAVWLKQSPYTILVFFIYFELRGLMWHCNDQSEVDPKEGSLSTLEKDKGAWIDCVSCTISPSASFLSETEAWHWPYSATSLKSWV